jgi:hypothetical protein
LKFFRVLSRFGLFLPMLAGAMLALFWPTLVKFFSDQWSANRKKARVLTGLFAAMALCEFWTLTLPPQKLPALNEGMLALLEKVKAMPGDTVINFPFCVAGGNGICTSQQCPQYPDSSAPAILTSWHGKKVYGTYQARLVPEQCEIYNRTPYLSWFKAWQQQRCLNGTEWDDFCSYLDQHPETAALMVYPTMWRAFYMDDCRQEWEGRFGKPLERASMMLHKDRTGKGNFPTEVLVYSARCKKPPVSPEVSKKR